MYEIIPSGQFKKDIKLAKSRGLDIKLIADAIKILAQGQKLPAKYRDHRLTNSRKYKNMRECHILSDWLLVYEICDKSLILYLIRTGTHSDLF